ncbi:MAG: inositol monophosphatase family protein, partial [Candidatus Omnitrophota bacterium]
MIAVIAIVAIFIIYKILRWYFSQKPLILKEKMDDVLFVKGDKKVYFPGKILSKLHHMTKIARELKIEMGADMEIEDGKAVDVIYEDDPNKIAVITADLPAETRMNTTSYYTDTYMSLAMLRNWASYYLGKNTLKKLSEAGIRERFEKNAREAKEAFSRHHSKISYFSQNKGERVDIDSQNILSVLDLPEDELKKFAEDLYHISTAATEWIGATSIAERRGKVDAEYIHFHNHPIGYPSPPSAIREGGKVWGDIYSPNFFKGRVSGLILDTEKGDELFLLYETDDSSEQEYIDMYEKYWEEGDVVENRKACILEDLRKVSMTPTDKINLESLQSQIRDIVVTKAKDIMLEERYRKEIKVVERKKGGDRATIADVKIGKLLKKKLTKLIPGSVVIEEESFTPEHFEKSKQARFVWVVDPIDGTAAYEEGVKEGNDEYCVGICLLYNGKPILSTVYAPEYEVAGHTGCLFEARDDLEGAYLNGERIQMDQGVDFENGRCITHIHKDEKHK